MGFLSPLAPYVHWGIRLSLAATFIYHGVGKFPPDGFVEWSGLPMPVGWLVALGEVGAGILLIAGAVSKEMLTRLGGLLVVVIMIGAILLVHLKQGWSGMEFQVLMLVTGLYFAARGNDV